LVLWGCYSLTDQAVIALAHNINTSLQQLSLAECELVTDNAIAVLTFHCPNLLLLDLAQLRNVNDNALSGIANLKNLEILDLKSAKITERALNIVINNALHLRILNVGQCLKVGDFALFEVGKLLYNLAKLSLNGCKRVTEAGIISVAKGCPLLNEIHLSGVLKTTDSAVKILAKSCPNLSIINLTQCSLITDKSVRAIMHHLHSIRTVNFSQCKFVTEESVNKLRDKVPGAAIKL